MSEGRLSCRPAPASVAVRSRMVAVRSRNVDSTGADDTGSLVEAVPPLLNRASTLMSSSSPAEVAEAAVVFTWESAPATAWAHQGGCEIPPPAEGRCNNGHRSRTHCPFPHGTIAPRALAKENRWPGADSNVHIGRRVILPTTSGPRRCSMRSGCWIGTQPSEKYVSSLEICGTITASSVLHVSCYRVARKSLALRGS